MKADHKAAADKEEEVTEELAGFLARAEAFLSRLSSENRSEARPLVAPDAAPE